MGKLNVQTTKLQDVKIITPPSLVITGVSLKKLTLIVTSRQLELTLTLFKITNHFQHRRVFCADYTFNGEKQPKQS